MGPHQRHKRLPDLGGRQIGTAGAHPYTTSTSTRSGHLTAIAAAT